MLVSQVILLLLTNLVQLAVANRDNPPDCGAPFCGAAKLSSMFSASKDSSIAKIASMADANITSTSPEEARTTPTSLVTVTGTPIPRTA